jgi:hypothetical protein
MDLTKFMRKFFVFVLVIILLIFATTLIRSHYYKNNRIKLSNNETLLLEWDDTDNDIYFRVTERPGAIVHTFTRLYVERNGRVSSTQIDDDAKFGTISFVRYDNWLLVLNNDEVWAGYNYSNSSLKGEHMWKSLPFTIRKNKGIVVAQKKVRNGGFSPTDFPYIPEENVNQQY